MAEGKLVIEKVIILDIDGPIIPGRWLWQGRGRGRWFDPCATAMLLNLMRENKVKLVLCSTWRKHGWESVAADFKRNGIDADLFFHEDWQTKSFEDRGNGVFRQDEIREWLGRHKEITKFCVVDDELHDIPNMVHVSFKDGLLWEHYLLMQEFLDVKPF